MPEFNSIPAEKWEAGEAMIEKVLNHVRPTLDSEDKRTRVVDYLRRLLKTIIGVQVLQYGSVPLKTYLPQGDIDLTVVTVSSICNWKRDYPREVYEVLRDHEQLNGNDEFMIRNTQIVDAEVKLVKCIVNGILIDISFNQLGGVCALCFFEKVDRLSQKEHLFKRSIILIKSWCYYESHILGAIRGLISTYALETLVLYIFLMYNKSLTSPLQVLYLFLEYYSTFDWSKFCISVDGLVNRSSLPDIVVVEPINHPFLNGVCMGDCVKMFTVPCKASVGNMPTFTPKVVNIIDPLKTSNNLGRSINPGTYYRIRLALGRGARMLGEIMELPRENIQERMEKFFDMTLNMNQSKSFLQTRSSFEILLESSVTEVHYEDDSDSELDEPNATRDTNINDNGGGENMNPDGSPDDRIVNANGKVDEGNDLNFANLLGDYDGNVRSLLHSLRCQGFPYSWIQHVQVQPNTNGSVMLPTGPFRRTNERGRVPPFPNHQMNWARGSTYETGSSSGANSNSLDPQSPHDQGQCGAPSQVHTPRRLALGNFDPVSPTEIM